MWSENFSLLYSVGLTLTWSITVLSQFQTQFSGRIKKKYCLKSHGNIVSGNFFPNWQLVTCKRVPEVSFKSRGFLLWFKVCLQVALKIVTPPNGQIIFTETLKTIRFIEPQSRLFNKINFLSFDQKWDFSSFFFLL